MKRFVTGLTLALTTMLLAMPAVSMELLDSSSVVKGQFAKMQCATGMSCSISKGIASVAPASSLSLSGTLAVTGASTLTGGVAAVGGKTIFAPWPTPTLTSGTSTTPSATTLYMVQVFIPTNVTLTGIAINNAGTVGTNKYVVALFDNAGNKLANSATAGALTSGASSWQKVAFTATKAVTGPATYWIGLYVDGTTDRFYAIPAVGAYSGLAGTVTSQTFGTVANVTPPTTFTADAGPVSYVY